MQLVVSVIVDRDLDALFLIKENLHESFWFPYDAIKPGETRLVAAKRLAQRVTSNEFESTFLFKILCSDSIPYLSNNQFYYLFFKERTTRFNGVNGIWMNLDQLSSAIKTQELLGPEPFYLLKTILERKSSNNDWFLNRQIFEENVFQTIEWRLPEGNSLPSSSQTQLVASAKFNEKIQQSVFKEFYSFTFPSEFMNLKNFSEAMQNKLSTFEQNRIGNYFRAFDSFQNGYLTFTDYLLGLAAMDPNTSHGGAPAELRCRYIFRFYNVRCSGSLTFEEFRDLHVDVQQLKNPRPPIENAILINEVFTAFNSFNLQTNNQLQLGEFLSSVGQLKYRGTSVLFRLANYAEDCLKICKRYQGIITTNERNPEKFVYELADHCVTLKQDGKLSQVESLRSMTFEAQMSRTTEDVLRKLPRSPSTEIFDRRNVAKEVQELLKIFARREKNKEPLSWSSVSVVDLARSIVNLCREVREILIDEPRCLKISSPCYILGDIHGNYEDLICFEKSLWRPTPLLTAASFLFLGDFVDRGNFGLEVVLYLFATKYLCPRKFLLLRGNHEIRKVQQMFSFYKECLTKFGDQIGREVWETINSVFDVLPLAAVIDDQILCLHGGIPSPSVCPGDFVSSVNRINVPLVDPELESSLAWEIMWNDPFSSENNMSISSPTNINNGFFNNSRRSTGKFFTSEALINFLDKNNFTHVIRAHEVQQVGFKVQLGGRLLTVFSSSHYCGGTNKAATVFVDDGKLRLIKLDAN